MFFLLSVKIMYVAIIGDLVRSRQIRDRNAVQCQLQAALDQVNKKYADQIAANFLITLGDEFQGILQEPGCLMPILSDIADAIRPVQVRFGVGIGELTTEVNRNAAIGAAGPAFYRARSAINTVHQRKNQSCIRLESVQTGSILEALLQDAVDSAWEIRCGWTKQQRRIIALLSTGMSQAEAGRRLTISQSSVYSGLHLSQYTRYISLTEHIRRGLEALYHVS